MAIKAAMFQNWMLTTNLSRFPASFKYCLFPQRIYLALDALSLSIFWKSAEGGGGSFPILNVIVNKFCYIVSRGEGRPKAV